MADEPVSMGRCIASRDHPRMNSELSTANLGISIVYITHDLTTAYQICDSIVILYQGTVAEAGSGRPRHPRPPGTPYTQLLVSSIPAAPTGRRNWGGEELKIPEASARPDQQRAAAFAPRCPHVMEECWSAPAAENSGSTRTRIATCFLYKDRPISGEADVLRGIRPAPK